MEDSSSVGRLSDFFAAGEEVTQDVFYGPGISSEVGDFAQGLGKSALLVTDQGLSAAGHASKTQHCLEQSGLKVTLFDQCIENPTEASVQSCVEIAKAGQIDVIVGLGGGSSMDTAKGCNFILTNGGRMSDYWGIGKATRDMLPLIALPTTAGTGSECQSFALISEDQTHKKMACGDSKALPRITILDPELTLSQPKMVSACTGIDALTHALESAVTTKRNELSDRHAQVAFKLIHENLPQVFDVPDDVEARGHVLLGASHAGAAIERSMLGAAHSMANPLTAKYGTVHGVAVGLSLPVVMQFNAQHTETKSHYVKLSRNASLVPVTSSDDEAFQALISRVYYLLGLAGFPSSLQELGVVEEDLHDLATEASGQWTAGFNPRPLEVDDFAQLYLSLFTTAPCQGEKERLG